MRRVVEFFLIGTSVLMFVFWGLWFAKREWVAAETTETYVTFENAFPLADGVVVVWCVLALIAMRRQHPTALLFLLLSVGGMAFLFSMDFLYAIQHGVWFAGTGGAIEALIEIAVLSYCCVVGYWAWTHRDELLYSSRDEQHQRPQ